MHPVRECRAIAAVLRSAIFSLLSTICRQTSHTDLDSHFYRSVPTSDQVLIPETLLKKRKSNEKAVAEKKEAAEKKRVVRHTHSILISEEAR